jgi:hypothetical protein
LASSFCAFYTQPYKFTNAKELLTIIMARFYVVLLILSRTLSKVLLKSSQFSLEMEEKAPELLATAKGLRHAELLKDPLLLCLEPWQKPVSQDSKMQSFVLAMGSTNPLDPEGKWSRQIGEERVLAAGDTIQDHSNKSSACLPCFYRSAVRHGGEYH